jgi:hypothetical protein
MQRVQGPNGGHMPPRTDCQRAGDSSASSLSGNGYAAKVSFGLRRSDDKFFENLKLRQFLPLEKLLDCGLRFERSDLPACRERII